jgi:PHP family Zn ribbon phosphoesterase
MSLGLQFRKVDLHCHTPASKCFLDKNASAADIVQAALDAGLDAIAITDHNTGDWIDRVKQAAQDTGLTVFPGVEITASEAFHIVALFDTEQGTADVASLLGALDITPQEQGRTDALCTHGAHKIIEKIVDRGGLAILAHIDEPRGAFTTLSGNPLIRLFNEAAYTAVETATGELPADLSEKKGFRRLPACYQASDNPDPDQPKKHSCQGMGVRFSYFKLDEAINLEGLRQCFADPQVRIRRMELPFEESPFPRVVSLKASDGFLKYQNIRFHPGLNSIIGGKGVGKSLIVEFLRFALDQPSDDSDIRRDYNGKLDKRLGPYNQVEVVCQMPSGTQYQITRTLNGTHECLDLGTDQPYNGSVSALFPILAYSQTEVIKIAEDEEAQLKLIDSFIEVQPHLSRIEAIARQVAENDQNLAEAIRAHSDLASFQKDLDTVNNRIGELDKLLAESKEKALFDEFQVLEAKKLALEAQQGYLPQLRESIDEVREQVKAALPSELPPEQEADADLAWVYRQSQEARTEILGGLDAIQDGIEQRAAAIAKRIDEWRPVFDAKKTEYMAALEKEKDKKKLEARRQGLVEQRQEARRKVKACQATADRMTELQSERDKLLGELDRAYEEYFTERNIMFEALTQRSDGKLRLELTHAANRRRFQEQLRELVRGSGARTADIATIAEKMMPRQFVELVCQRDVEGMASQADISSNAAQTMVDKLWSGETIQPVLALEHTCYPEDVPSIKFRKDDAEYAPLDELSVGQKCTALLIIALSEGTRPVIIDQPEDALDITTVWEDISMKLRQGKEKRQFILTTHNPSVAVASDSDMFIVVKSSAQQASVKCWGAIEHPDVKKAVIQHLEGGEEPYQLRLHKYNLNL